MSETHNVEYKQSWRDEYLKWICGFANAQGGKIFIGIDDKGEVVGVADYKKLMDDIPNKTVNHLGLVVDVNLHKKNDLHYIEIEVPVSTVPISYHGAYHYRSGSTKQELKGNALNQFMLKKMNLSWEQQPIPEASLKDIDEEAIKSFTQKALRRQRISENAANADPLTILKNLKLVNEDGEFLLAALLLFGKEPQRYATMACYKMGRFGKSHSDLRFQDVIEGNILDMADKVMSTLDAKYLIRPISYQGLQRIEGLEYPESALRECILNSIIHKDYSSTFIFLRVYDDQLSIWNPGGLPDTLSIEQLKQKHSSFPRNKLIANVFFMAGYIESWGRGIDIMVEGCKQYGIPEPIIEEEQGGISVTFLKDIYTEEYLRTMDINDRQVNAVLYIKEHGKINNSIYQEINKISKPTATRELKDLIEKDIISNIGTKGSSSEYVLVGS
jgi:ATP-dependent DNA helicase RecG